METIRDGKVLFVKVPEDASELQVGHFTHHLMYCDKTGFSKSVILPEGNWTILGKAFELMEEQKEKCVESKVWKRSLDGSKFTTYLDYMYLKVHNEYLHDIFEVSKSYDTLLEAHKITKDYIVLTDK